MQGSWVSPSHDIHMLLLSYNRDSFHTELSASDLNITEGYWRDFDFPTAYVTQLEVFNHCTLLSFIKSCEFNVPHGCLAARRAWKGQHWPALWCNVNVCETFSAFAFLSWKGKKLAYLSTLMLHLLSKWRMNNQCVCKRGDMGGSDKYNRPNETIKAQLPSFPPSDIYCPTHCVCVGCVGLYVTVRNHVLCTCCVCVILLLVQLSS